MRHWPIVVAGLFLAGALAGAQSSGFATAPPPSAHLITPFLTIELDGRITVHGKDRPMAMAAFWGAMAGQSRNLGDVMDICRPIRLERLDEFPGTTYHHFLFSTAFAQRRDGRSWEVEVDEHGRVSFQPPKVFSEKTEHDWQELGAAFSLVCSR